jgi:Activator of Hsp90 ATPase homolog 1-like protein
VITGKPRAIADCAEGSIVASVDLAACPERVFQALASSEITQWWVRSEVFDTREWSGEVRNQGRWSATGMARGQPYALEREFVEVDPPQARIPQQRLGLCEAGTDCDGICGIAPYHYRILLMPFFAVTNVCSKSGVGPHRPSKLVGRKSTSRTMVV